jgi:membrane protein involved in colicin uptake
MPVHDRPKRLSVKKAQDEAMKAKAAAEHAKAVAKARRAASAESATKKRVAKMTVDDLSGRFSNMRIEEGGRRHRKTRRATRKTRKNSRV